MEPTAQDIERALEAFATPAKKAFLPRFFKTGEGQYGAGDLFMGVVVPDIRQVAKSFKRVSLLQMENLLHSPLHECRMCALLIMVEKFAKADKADRKKLLDIYLSNADCINNWDLVDLSAPKIPGEYLKESNEREILYTLAKANDLWRNRIAMVSTLTFIHNDDFADCLRLAELFLTHRHDLMHKASGWMLRETGKRYKPALLAFLDNFAHIMPRTMLRYAIEKLSPAERKYYMQMKTAQ